MKCKETIFIILFCSILLIILIVSFLLQLSYADTNPMLSDRDQFPNFYRTVPSDSDFNPARLALLRHFNWTTVGIVFQHAKLGEARHGYVSVVPDMFASVASLSEL